jgi:DNA-binding NtrC family response regulator
MRSKYVLVVDDDDDVRESIGDVLTLDGHAVVGVENGEQAIGSSRASSAKRCVACSRTTKAPSEPTKGRRDTDD